MTSLAGKTAMIVGASGGLGSAICRELSRRGAYLVLAGRNTSKLHRLNDELSSRHQVVELDITQPESIKLVAHKRCVDILVNSAGISRDSLLSRVKLEDISTTMETNLVGAINTTKEFSKHMPKGGCIVNVASVVGLMGNRGQSVYAASKAGLVGFTKAVARELGPRNIRANVVAPGFILTEMTKELIERPVTRELLQRVALQRIGAPEDVAHAVAFLAESQYITGQLC
ncbi:hypothetical protein EDC05_005114 [Coemansia umbellata]|uniref:Ketoreductase domain-containing protein n=1 Tax=Coemansia umbellata TaxID=1424467 RepID=A0ABQ8PHB8_9FUNG|nr:hypothetical protein EDC05_005114 [Coemansia umbellata]